MAKYIKQEVPDMLKTGEQKLFYRLKGERNYTKRLVNQITYISLTNQDVGEVIDGGSSNIFESIWSFLTSWA